MENAQICNLQFHNLQLQVLDHERRIVVLVALTDELQIPLVPNHQSLITSARSAAHSHSIVLGGLLEMS